MQRRSFLAGLGSAGLALASGGARPAFASGKTLKQIKEAGILRFGVEATFVPFAFRKDGGNIIGYDVDLADLFCAELGVKPDVVDTLWSGVIPALYAGKFDVIPSLTYTKERMQRVAFSIPYVEASQVMLIRAADAGKIKSLQDLSNKVVATKLGAPSDVLAKKWHEQMKTAGGPGFNDIKAFNDDPPRYMALAQGRVDAVFNMLSTLTVVMKDQPGQFAIVKGLGADNWSGIGTRKEDVELVEFLDTQIRKLKASGEIYRLQEKWFGLRMDLPDAVPAV